MVMHLLAYWRIDNYVRDLDEGAGFHFNSRQERLHSAIEAGENLWLFTALRNPLRLRVVARLCVRAKTVNAPGYKYGDFRVWGDLERSQYFQARAGHPEDEAFDVLRGLPLVSGSLAWCTPQTMLQACQTIRGVTAQGDAILQEFVRRLTVEPRARQVVDEVALERGLWTGEGVEELLQQHHAGASAGRIRQLVASARRDRMLARELHDLYGGRCQVCGFDSPLVYGVPAAEAHHLVYLSRGGEDTRENIVILCPNHHTVVHKTEARFDYGRLWFVFPNGRTEPLCLNQHLQPRRAGAGTGAAGERPRDADVLGRLIVEHLTPDLLTGAWAAERTAGTHPLAGYCYVASEALYHLMGGRESGWMVFRNTYAGGKTHWWLVDDQGKIRDLTAGQFAGSPPYDLGRRTQFLSAGPSRRARQLMGRVLAELAGEEGDPQTREGGSPEKEEGIRR